MNPLSLSVRPLILPSNYKLSIRTSSNLKSKKRTTYLTIDGKRKMEILPEYIIKVTKHKKIFRFMRPAGYSFFKAIRNKLDWKGNRTVI